MFFELKVAIRFLTSGKSQTLLIIIGISIGVAVQIFLSSLISGLQKDLVNKTVGTSSHIIVKPQNNVVKEEAETTIPTHIDKKSVDRQFSNSSIKKSTITSWSQIEKDLSSHEGIKSVAVFADGSAFVNKGEKNQPVSIRGSLLEKSTQIYKISENLIKGEARVEGNDIVIGKSLAEEYGYEPGSILRLSTPDGTQNYFTVSGIFDIGNQTINKSWVFIDFNRAQKLFELNGAITSIEIQVYNVFDAEQISKELQSNYKDVSIESWQVANKQLLTALSSQSSSSNLIQVFVILAVALGISSVLAVSAMQKSKQIGILKAMGTNNQSVSKIFLFQGLILGFIGSILGSALGIGLIRFFTFITKNSGAAIFTIDVGKNNILFAVLFASIIGTIAASIPARTSARLDPMEVIRNG